MPADVKDFLVQWMDKAQAILGRRAAVQQHAEQPTNARSRAASISGISISDDSLLTGRRIISTSSERSVSRQLHREESEHELVGLGRLDISSDSDSDDQGSAGRGRGRRPSTGDVVTRDEDDHAAPVSRQQD